MFILLLLGFWLGSAMGQQPHVAIGDILCSDGSTLRRENWSGASAEKTPIGIVFYVERKEGVWHGWALNLNESERIFWADNGYSNRNFNTPITDKAAAVSDTLGIANTNTVFALLSGTELTEWNYPAYHYIEGLRATDTRWYLPALGQLNYLYAQIPEINLTVDVLNSVAPNTAKRIEGDADGTFSYWPSTEYNEGFIWYLNYDGGCAQTGDKSAYRRARAVRSF